MKSVPFPHEQLVLDTSVIIKWYRQGEVLAPQALVLRDLYLTGLAAVSVPSLLVYELTNVFRYKEDLNTGQIQEAVQSLFDMDLQIVPPSFPVMKQAVEIARTHRTTIYDAVFVALAQILPAIFVTADERLAQCLAALTFVHSLKEVEV